MTDKPNIGWIAVFPMSIKYSKETKIYTVETELPSGHYAKITECETLEEANDYIHVEIETLVLSKMTNDKGEFRFFLKDQNANPIASSIDREDMLEVATLNFPDLDLIEN